LGRLKEWEIDWLENPQNYTFEHFTGKYFANRSIPEKLAIADDELLNHYHNSIDNKVIGRTLIVPKMDPNHPKNYERLEEFVNKLAILTFSARLSEDFNTKENLEEFRNFKKAGLTAFINLDSDFHRRQLVRKIADSVNLNPFLFDDIADIFYTGSSLYFLELYSLLLQYRQNSYFLNYFRSDPEELKEKAKKPQILLKLWKHQQFAIDNWYRADGKGIIEMATATGKTLVGLAAAESLYQKEKNVKVLIVSHSRAILNQWRREVIDKLGFTDDPNLDYNHSVQYNSPGKKLHFSFNTLQSVSKNPDFFSKDIDFLIVDEVHHGASKEFRKAVNLTCKYKMGLSATIEGKERPGILSNVLGLTVFTYSLRKAKKDGIIPNFKLIIHKSFLDVSEQEIFESVSKKINSLLTTINAIRGIKIKKYTKYGKFDSLYDFISAMNKARYSGDEVPESWLSLLGLIIKRRSIIHKSSPKIEDAIKLIKVIGNEKKCLVFCMDISTSNHIHSQIKSHVDNAFCIHSEMKNHEVMETIQLYKKSRTGVLISPKMLDEGIDIPDAEIGINVASSKTKLQLVQRMGRILRKQPGKNPEFHHFVALPHYNDFIDNEDPFNYSNDLAWIQDIALKMNLDFEFYDAKNQDIQSLERRSEGKIKEYFHQYQHIPDRDYGTIKMDSIISAVFGLRAKVIEKLRQIEGPITDEAWMQLLRNAHGSGDFTNETSRFRWLLIIGNRNPGTIEKLIVEHASDDEPQLIQSRNKIKRTRKRFNIHKNLATLARKVRQQRREK